MKKGGHFVGHVQYGAADLRYTRSKDGKTLYVTALGNPGEHITLTSLTITQPVDGIRVVRIDDNREIPVDVNAAGQLVLKIPGVSETPTATYAVAFEVTGLP